jgi:DNA replication protein DnaC
MRKWEEKKVELIIDERKDKLSEIDRMTYEREMEQLINNTENLEIGFSNMMPIIKEVQGKYRLFHVPLPNRKGILTGSYKELINNTNCKILNQEQINVAKTFFEKKFGFIHGEAGVGKSTIAICLTKKLLKLGINVHYDKAKDITMKFKHFMNVQSKSEEENFKFLMESLYNVEVLVIDDFAREYLTEWVIHEVWSPIVQYRMDNNYPTYITCNYSLEELGKRIAEKTDFTTATVITDRFIEKMPIVHFKGKNHRL